MLLSLYKNLMTCTTPLIEAYLNRRMKAGREDKARFAERRGVASRPRGKAPLVWFHGASVGEAQSLLSLISHLLELRPDIQIMVTTGTVTSARLMVERLPERAFHQYIPVDHPAWVRKFLDHWQPDLVVWSESDFWPNMMLGVQQRRIPAVLVNARMSEKSFRRWKLSFGMINRMLETFTLCLAQNDAEAARLTRLGARAVRVSGNLKYAARPLPYDSAQLEALQKAVGGRPLLLWASTHPGEEDVACRIHKKLQIKDLLTIIVPRHPKRGDDIAALVAATGLKVRQRSGGQLPQSGDDVYVADTLGEMGLFYRFAPSCIMGGSFVPHGGHNPIEPAQLGCQIFYGPHMFNFLSICDDFESHGAAVRAGSEDEMVQLAARAFTDPAVFASVRDAARQLTAERAHVVDGVVAAIAPLIPKERGTA